MLRFLVIVLNTFSSYKPFQGFRGPAHCNPFQGLGGPTHRIFCIFTFEDAVMKKIMEKEVIPDHQRMKMKISFVQVQLFEFEFDFKDDNLHNIMNMKISFVKVQVFESGFDLETKIETKLCLDTIYLYPQNETEVCLCSIQSIDLRYGLT